MTPHELLDKARRLGIDLQMQPAGTLAIGGPVDAVERLLPELNAHRTALVALLRETRSGRLQKTAGTPYRCAGCWRWFGEDDLAIVAEEVGRGFRCQTCLREAE